MNLYNKLMAKHTTISQFHCTIKSVKFNLSLVTVCICDNSSLVGVNILKKTSVKEILLESFGDPEACAEGGHLANYCFDMKGTTKQPLQQPTLDLWRYRIGKIK